MMVIKPILNFYMKNKTLLKKTEKMVNLRNRAKIFWKLFYTLNNKNSSNFTVKGMIKLRKVT